MKNRWTISEYNKGKYEKAPTWEMIESFLKEVGINKYRFETFYGIARHHLAKVKCGAKDLAPCYWHIFYEKIRLEKGIAFEGVYEQLYMLKRGEPIKKRVIPKNIPSIIHAQPDSHDRLTKVV